MTRKKLKTTFIITSLTAIAILSFMPVSWGKSWQSKEKYETSLASVHLTQLPAVLQSLKAAEKAIQSNDKDTALSALKDAKKQLWAVKKITGKHLQPLILNSPCPLSGDEINVAKLTSESVRSYQGQFVAFCCADCSSEWDTLNDAKRKSKLSKVSSTSIWTCSMHPQIRIAKSGKCPICLMALTPATESPKKGSNDGHSGHNH